jgi:hypothetical protein
MTDSSKKIVLKRVGQVVLTFVVIAVLFYVGLWVAYYFATEKSNRETRITRCKEDQEAYFEGEIIRIDRYEYSSFMNSNYFGLEIKTNDTARQFVTYQFDLKSRKTVLDFVSIGQKMRKEKGSTNFILFIENDKRKEFKLPYCD